MSLERFLMAGLLVAGSGLALNAAPSQPPTVTRKDLLRHDLGAVGREVL